jgi:hypothetical protein
MLPASYLLETTKEQVADLDPTMEPTTESQAYPFTPAEFARLAAFRQAVLAGFYTDQLRHDAADGSFETSPVAEVMAAHPDADAA